MRLFAIDRLDTYARERVQQGSKAWEIQRAIADVTQARLVGTMMVRLEAEFGVSHSAFFLNQKEGRTDGQTKKDKDDNGPAGEREARDPA